MAEGTVFISIEIDADLTLGEAWPDGVPDDASAAKLAADLKAEHRSLGSFLRDWDLDAGGYITITVVDETGNRTHADLSLG